MLKDLKKGYILLLLLSAISFCISSVIPSKQDLICSPTDSSDCYELVFVPTTDWQPIREGQQIPQGLDIQLDWQTGAKVARISEGSKKQTDHNQLVEVIESDSNKIVCYNSEEDKDEDSEINALKMAVQGSSTTVDIDDALEYIVSNVNSYDDSKLINSLDALTEHSHSLKDGITISNPVYFDQLVQISTDSKRYDTQLRELALRIIAQALRHNNKALDNVDVRVLFPKLFKSLDIETNSVIQKRLLGVISSLVQAEANAAVFTGLDGEAILLNNFHKLQKDSQVRSLEILEDVKNFKLIKRSEQDAVDSKLFHLIQDSLSNGESSDENSLELLFDKLVELKTENKSFKTNNSFIEWLSKEVEDRKLVKRDSEEDDKLHRKLLEARHLVFGNPNALRKALADEL